MIEILTYLQLFASYFTAALQFFSADFITYQTYVAIVFALTVIVVIYNLSVNKIDKSRFIQLFGFLLFVLLLYYITPSIYGRTAEHYNSYFIVLSVQTIPAMLSALIVVNNKKVQTQIKKMTPFLAILFSFLAYYAVFFPSSTTSGGLAQTENNLNYQSISYLSAFAAAFAGYYILSYKHVRWPKIFSGNKVRLFMFFLIALNLINIFLSGGRGGLVAFALQTLLILISFRNNRETKKTSMFTKALVMGAVLVIGYVSIEYAQHSQLESSGYERVAGFASGDDEASRLVLWQMYFGSILDSPIVGHGMGSVFYESDFYSHNVFVDAMVETGIIGTLIIVIAIFLAFKYGRKMAKKDISDSIWLILLMDGFAYAMFSGYYIAHVTLWWSVVFMISQGKSDQRKRIQAKRVYTA